MNKQPHILIVDDDSEIRDLLSEYLSTNQFKTSVARNGDEMFEFLSKQETDLIVLDVMMPGDDGLTLCRKIREQANTPIIILTAVDSETDRVLGLEFGADDYQTKPFIKITRLT